MNGQYISQVNLHTSLECRYSLTGMTVAMDRNMVAKDRNMVAKDRNMVAKDRNMVA